MRKIFFAVIILGLFASKSVFADTISSTSSTLSLNLSNLKVGPYSMIEGDVTLKNIGSDSITVSTGWTGQGCIYHYRLKLKARDSNGQSIPLDVISDCPIPPVGGKIPFYRVQLSPQESNTFHIRWGHDRTNLASGNYAFYAQYESDLNIPTPETDWNTKSNEVQLTIP